MRVLLGLTEVGGYYARLKAGFDELDVQADLVTLNRHRFEYDAPPAPRPARVLTAPARWMRERSATAPRLQRLGLRALHAPTLAISQCLLLAWALVRYDAFIFGFNATFLRTHDLVVLRLARKRIIGVYHGSDSRPAYLDGFVCRGVAPGEIVRATRRARRRVARMERYADVIVCGVLSAQLHRRPFVPFQLLGLPSHKVGPPTSPPRSAAETVVVHAPSDPVGKGSDRIREAVADVKAEGVPLRYVEITGRPHQEVLRELARADLLVDQLYSDTTLAGLGTEAASSGCPSLVGTYGATELRALLGGGGGPVALAHPDDFAKTLRELCTDKEARERLGQEAHAFVTGAWAPRLVAGRFLRLIQGDPPPEWLADPLGIRYHLGIGLRWDAVRSRIQAVVDVYGVEGLMLEHNLGLQQAMVTGLELRLPPDRRRWPLRMLRAVGRRRRRAPRST